MDRPVTFGEWLRQRREALHLSRPQLAQRANCSTPALRKIELGERRASAQLAQSLARAIGLSPEEQATFVRVARGELNLERLPLPAATAAQEFPPPGRAPSLPIPATPLVGRESESAELARLLADPQCRLLTLTGPGGIGKTRLAIGAAAAYQATRPAYFVSLAALHSVEVLLPAIADALDFQFSGSADPAAQLLRCLRDKSLLLVLDNFEHLLPDSKEGDRTPGACALVAAILQGAPRVKLLVTSRERLELHGEWVFDLHGLPLPEPAQAPSETNSSAVALFVQSARRAQAGFAPQAEEWAHVARICRMVAGVPLAIELAAAWAPVLSCADIAAELERTLASDATLGFLTTSRRDVPERHRSMRAVIDHSWMLLSDDERRALQRLAVFRGGFSREAAERVAGASLGLLSALVTKSLVQRAGTARYDLHELVRQYVASKLAAETSESHGAQERHSLYFLGLVEELDRGLRGSRQKQALAELTTEMDNLRQAWAWAARHQDGARLRRAAATLWYVFELHTWFVEGEVLFRHAAEQLETRAGAEQDEGRRPELELALQVLRALSGYFSFRQGRIEAAHAALLSAAVHPRTGADPFASMFVPGWLGVVCWAMGRFAEAQAHLHASLAASRAHAEPWYAAWSLMGIGNVEHEQGAYPQARRALAEALAASRVTGDPLLTAHVLHCLSRTVQTMGDSDQSEVLLQESLILAREVGYRAGAGMALDGLGRVAQARGQWHAAHALFSESCAVFREIDAPHQLAPVLNHQGLNLLAMGDAAGAGESFRAALALGRESGSGPMMLDALAGLAALHAEHGVSLDSLELAFVVLEHPASTQEAKNLCAQVRAQLESRLPPEQVEAARQSASSKGLAGLVGQVLDGIHP